MKITIEIPEVSSVVEIVVLARPGYAAYSKYFKAKILEINGRPQISSLTKEELVSKIEKLNVNDSWRIFLEEIIRRLP